MNSAFYEDLQTLCQTQVVDSSHAEQILDILAELISDEVMAMSPESRDVCCSVFINSKAYTQELLRSRETIVSWLVHLDKLQTQRLLFIGLLVLRDIDRILPCIGNSPLVFQAMVDTVWTYRFTELELVDTFMQLLYETCTHCKLDEVSVENSITIEFANYLYHCVQEDSLAESALLLIVVLNDQFMLNDKRDDENIVFTILRRQPTRYPAVCSSLVMVFNRCKHDDQNLKIFICKYLYLVFTTPITADLLYTNDLIVLAEILIRELNDLPVEETDVRCMYLRLLYSMLKFSPIGECEVNLRSTMVQVLRMTLDGAEFLTGEDHKEVTRLAERCLEVSWLGWQSSDSTPEPEQHSPVFNSKWQDSPSPDPQPSQTHPSNQSPTPQIQVEQEQAALLQSHPQAPQVSLEAPLEHQPLRQPPCHQSSDIVFIESLPLTRKAPPPPPRKHTTRLGRPPPPPPPPPPPRHHSVASIASSDLSIDAVEQFRPPLPPGRK